LVNNANYDENAIKQFILKSAEGGRALFGTDINKPGGNNKPPEPSKETQIATKAMGGAQSLFMAVSAMNSSANTFKTILDSSASGAEKFGAVLSTAASLLMSFATVT